MKRGLNRAFTVNDNDVIIALSKQMVLGSSQLTCLKEIEDVTSHTEIRNFFLSNKKYFMSERSE